MNMKEYVPKYNIDSTDNPLVRKIEHKSKFEGKTITYQAYYEADAYNAGIEFEYWKSHSYTEQKECFFHVSSDDGIVFPVYRVHFTKRYIVLSSPFGNFILPRHNHTYAKIVFLPDNRAGKEDSWQACPEVFKPVKKIVATFAARGMSLNEIQEAMCNQGSIRPSHKRNFIRKFYKSEECTKMIREEVHKILENVGLTEEKVITMLLDAYDTALQKNDAANMIRSTENLIDLYGLKDKPKETLTRTIEIGSEVEDLQKLESVKERVKLSQKEVSE